MDDCLTEDDLDLRASTFSREKVLALLTLVGCAEAGLPRVEAQVNDYPQLWAAVTSVKCSRSGLLWPVLIFQPHLVAVQGTNQAALVVLHPG